MSDTLKPTVMPNDSYDKEDAYELMSLYLSSESGGKIDLKPLYQSVSFVEDITKSAMSGSIVIKDTTNIFASFPISGYESLVIQFRTPGIGADYTKKTFDVVEVTDYVKASNDRSSIYRLKFVSTTATKDKGIKISKSFKGKISDIASQIYSDYLGGNLNAQKTLNEQKFVIPRWSPFRTLEWLSRRAIPAQKKDETNYFFFETLDGHSFVTLSSLASADPVMKYLSVPSGIRDSEGQGSKEFGRSFSTAKTVSFIKTNQKLQEFMDGAFSSVLYQHDVTTKQWGRVVYNYNDDEKKIRQVSKNKLTKNDDKYVNRPDVSINLITKQSGLMGKDYPNTQNHEEWYQRQKSAQMLMDSIKVRISVSGNSQLRVGDVVELYIPKSSAIKSADTEWFDPYFSGKYLITTIRHTITNEGYKNTILLSKNGYEISLPDESTFLGTSSKQATSKIFGKK